VIEELFEMIEAYIFFQALQGQDSKVNLSRRPL
jgi:hypothetical protein